MHSNCRILPEEIVCKITQRNNIRRANTCDPALKLLNEEKTSDIQIHKHMEGAPRRSLGSQAQHTLCGRPYMVYPTENLHTHYIISGPLGLVFLTSMFKTALNKNIIPHTWKLANIAPIPKPNKDTDKGTSYRPISLLSVIVKTLEKSLLPYITENIPNTPMQHRYQKQHSTVTAPHTKWLPLREQSL